GFIYVLGGYSSGYLRRVRKYDPIADTWFVRGDMQGYRSSFGAAFINNRIYAIGGVALFPLATVEEYRIELDPKR
ncbi:MAG: kelch repeat-containing protein, partial [bacterium]|nr:kelch repeat-containing protein [bacterium]